MSHFSTPSLLSLSPFPLFHTSLPFLCLSLVLLCHLLILPSPLRLPSPSSHPFSISRFITCLSFPACSYSPFFVFFCLFISSLSVHILLLVSPSQFVLFPFPSLLLPLHHITFSFPIPSLASFPAFFSSHPTHSPSPFFTFSPLFSFPPVSLLRLLLSPLYLISFPSTFFYLSSLTDLPLSSSRSSIHLFIPSFPAQLSLLFLSPILSHRCLSLPAYFLPPPSSLLSHRSLIGLLHSPFLLFLLLYFSFLLFVFQYFLSPSNHILSFPLHYFFHPFSPSSFNSSLHCLFLSFSTPSLHLLPSIISSTHSSRPYFISSFFASSSYLSLIPLFELPFAPPSSHPPSLLYLLPFLLQSLFP